MDATRWIWCSACGRCFEVLLSREPRAEYPVAFNEELVVQLGSHAEDSGSPKCAYEGCQGNIDDFWWWNAFRRIHPSRRLLPEAPSKDIVYERSL